jgi:antibiotic biosynthesis monooxygenase (ABM) superfamily enzyme
MTSTAEHPVTVLISRQVRQGCEAEFERVMHQIMAVTATFAGYLGAQLVRPGDEQGVYDSLYHVVLAFNSESNPMYGKPHLPGHLGWQQQHHSLRARRSSGKFQVWRFGSNRQRGPSKSPHRDGRWRL